LHSNIFQTAVSQCQSELIMDPSRLPRCYELYFHYRACQDDTLVGTVHQYYCPHFLDVDLACQGIGDAAPLMSVEVDGLCDSCQTPTYPCHWVVFFWQGCGHEEKMIMLHNEECPAYGYTDNPCWGHVSENTHCTYVPMNERCFTICRVT
jgi:hypothetical protein